MRRKEKNSLNDENDKLDLPADFPNLLWDLVSMFSSPFENQDRLILKHLQ
jgi:hypothetical protein